MKKTLETTQVNSINSTFLIDLVKNPTGVLSVEIHQSHSTDDYKPAQIFIQPDSLSEIIKTLQFYHALIKVTRKIDTKHITKNRAQKIQDYYFKGVEISEISKLLDLPKPLIISELKKMDIEILESQQPKIFKRRRKKK